MKSVFQNHLLSIVLIIASCGMFFSLPITLRAQSVVVSGNQTPLNQTGCEEKDGVYCLLEPIPIGNSGDMLNKVEPTEAFGKYINIIIKIAIGITGTLAVIYIIVGGFTYMTTDAFSRKENGKEMIQHSFAGLIIALFAILLLYTINPQLTAIVFNAREVTVIVQEDWQDGTTPSTVGGGMLSAESQRAVLYRNGMRDSGSICQKGLGGPDTQQRTDLLSQAQATKNANANNFKDLTSSAYGIPVKSGAGKFTYKTLADNLKEFNTNYDTTTYPNYQITEAWQPTSNDHCARCHYLGTCVDANFTMSTAPSKTQVQGFISAASAAGLIAQYEVSTRAEYDALGIVDGSVLIADWISAPHFSVYDRQ